MIGQEFAMTITSAAITLFMLTDPVGNAPLFMSVLRNLDSGRRRRAILRESLFAFLILVMFLLFGRVILSLFGISSSALTTAGGVFLFLMAIRMIFQTPSGGILDDGDDDDPWLAPLAFPLIAGPSSMAWVMLLGSRSPERMMDWIIAIIAACVVGTMILLLINMFRNRIKDHILKRLERLMGILLIIISIQMIMDGISSYLVKLL